MTGLEKLQNAERLIRKMTGCRFKALIDSVFIYPEDHAHLTINIRRDMAGGNENHSRIHFDAQIHNSIKPMNADELLGFSREIGQAHALLTALEMQDFTVTPNEYDAFVDYVWQQEEMNMESDQNENNGLKMS